MTGKRSAAMQREICGTEPFGSEKSKGEIHSVRDITEEFKQHSGYEPTEPLLQVDLTYDCYGIITRETKTFWKSDFERAKKEGYFMA